jgi:hypothetical protein
MTTFQTEIAALLATNEAMGADELRGWDWFQLSDDEAAQFNISLAEFPRLLTAWQAYLAFCDITDASVADLSQEAVEAERLRLPQFYEGPIVSGETFKALAADWCGIAPDKAQAMYDKVDAWNERDALREDEEE